MPQSRSTRVAFHSLAAAMLAVPGLALAEPETPTTMERALVPPPPDAQLPPATLETVQQAIDDGVTFLIGNQENNGAWGSARQTKGLNIYAPAPGSHHAFRAGTTGLALSGMIDARDPRPEAQAAIERAAEWVIEELPKLRRAETGVLYNNWGHSYGLRALTRLARHDPDRKETWKQLAEHQFDYIQRFAEVHGGWGYYDFSDLHTQRPSDMPTSFTTGTMLLAVDEAREAFDIEFDQRIIDRALRSIRMQQTPDFSYTYSFPHRWRPRGHINRPAGSLARSQVCNAALRVFGDEAITDEVITEWADRFLNREGWLSIARKRPRPHDIHFQISGYFYYYGIFYFTEAVALLPRDQQRPYAEALAAILLDRQENDGSWWDYPLYAYHQPYGTGYALMALAWCRDVMAEQE